MAIARLTGVTSRHTQRHDARPGQNAVEELRVICSDPRVLSDAAAFFVASDDPGKAPYKGRAVALLTQAGAEAELIGEYVRLREADRQPDLLRIIADQFNRRGE